MQAGRLRTAWRSAAPLLPSFILTTMCHPQDHAHAWLHRERRRTKGHRRQRCNVSGDLCCNLRHSGPDSPVTTSIQNVGAWKGYYRRQRLIRLWLLASASWRQHLAGSLWDKWRLMPFAITVSEFRLQPSSPGRAYFRDQLRCA